MEPKGWSEDELDALERAHVEGMSVQQIVDAFTGRGARLTEATFRKYVQLGLLPRSVRVGRKGKHRGSQGLYPATAVRQIDHIRRLMSQGFTMEEIQREFLFVRGDIDALRRQLKRVYQAIEEAVQDQLREGGDEVGASEALREVRELGKELVRKLEDIERRLTMRARMARAAV
jgi:hypothetical protein